MKLNVKLLTLLLSAGIVFSLSGCGGGSSSTPVDTDPAPGELGYQVTNPDGSITYVDYTEGNRTAPASAADAEYHTGMGYGNTLFDSADNKWAIVFLRAAGANLVYVCATHPCFSDPAPERLSSVEIEEIVVTDTVPLPPRKLLPNITVLSVAPLLAEVIRRIHLGISVGALFNE
jgi:hypothetical protein